jgi:Flp pilus assembly pilin Flp
VRGRVRLGLTRQDGLTVIEYALIAALIFTVIVVAVQNLGIQVGRPYEIIGTQMAN